MKTRGWIYVITNNAMPGLVKIGYSTKDPYLRAKEFDCTGIPHPYELIYDVLLLEPREVEHKVHVILNDKREGKEWFRCSIEESIRAIRLASMDQSITETTHQQVLETSEPEGTFLDRRTKLMWAEVDNESDINWAGAKTYCENYCGGGYSGWRMPTLDELMELYENIENNANAIILTGPIIWASEIRGSDAAIFIFDKGTRNWLPRFVDYGLRALPVRSTK